MKTAIIIGLAVLSFATKGSAQKSAIYATNGVAINGYDAVAFFTKGKPVKGTSKYSLNWGGANWNFSSSANLESFRTSPEKYSPQYGGYCAYGTAHGAKAPTMPDTWTIVDGKLYFNYNMKVKGLWDQNRAALIDSANMKWPMVMDMQ